MAQIFLPPLKAKRAEIGGHIRDLERAIKRHRKALVHIDAAIPAVRA